LIDAAEFDIQELTERLRAIPGPADGFDTASGQFVDLGTGSTHATPVGKPAITYVTGVGASPPSPEDFEALKDALRGALQIEFATIPMYLTALWSIVDQGHVAAKIIRAVVHEEMLHLALVCNLLSALGERPVLTGARVPAFPCSFPGNVHRGLELRLEGYGPHALSTFMEIERPDKPVIILGVHQKRFPNRGKTIGAFYREIIAAFHKLEPHLSSEQQIAGPFAWRVMTTVEQVEKALNLIMQQGEGVGEIPFTRNPMQLSHYYRFKSLEMLRHLKWNAKDQKLKPHSRILPPTVFELAPAPPDGYGRAAPKEVRDASEKFDDTYSRMLQCLEGSWSKGGEKSFAKAIDLMFDLGPLARSIMQIETPDHLRYCPTFRYLP
jgi:hypothetical protein